MKVDGSLRSYQRTPQGNQPLTWEGGAVTRNQLPARSVGASRLEQESERLQADNLKRARHLERGLLSRGDQVLPKDSTVNPSHLVMAHNPEDGLTPRFMAQMAQVGQLEGFRILARCAPADCRELRSQLKQWPSFRNITVVPTPGVQDVWTEDQGEFTRQGHLVMPPLLAPGTPYGQLAFLGRLERLHPEVDAAQVATQLTDYNLQAAMQTYPRTNFTYQGLVGQSDTHLGMLGAALALGLPESKMALTYVEGGNFLPGTAADGKSLALVGRDSLAISASVLEQDLGRKPSERQVLDRVARDYGLKADQVHPVEQPADFHIDMAMTWTRPGHVLLNDSLAVLKMQKLWLKQQKKSELENSPDQAESIRARYRNELTRLESEANHRADLETLSLKDMQKAGVEVHRLAGSFPASLANPAMNFLNLRQGTAEDGSTFAVCLGGTPEVESYIREQLLEVLPTGYQRLHFLDPSLTAPTLDLWGGIKCRTKPLVVDG